MSSQLCCRVRKASDLSLTPYEANHEFVNGILLAPFVYRHRKCHLSNGNGSYVMGAANWRHLVSVEELKDVHDSEDLTRDDQHVTKCCPRAPEEGCMGCRVACHDGYEGICGDNEEEYLGGRGNMVVDEAAALSIGDTR